MKKDSKEGDRAQEQEEPGPVDDVRAAGLLLVAALVAVGALVIPGLLFSDVVRFHDSNKLYVYTNFKS